jgi:hypothetical protein
MGGAGGASLYRRIVSCGPAGLLLTQCTFMYWLGTVLWLCSGATWVCRPG